MLAKAWFWMHVSVGSLYFHYVRWTKNLKIVESLVIVTRTWSSYSVISKPDAAGAVRAHSGKGPWYCYMIARRPNSCLLGQVTGLLFCPYVKIFLPSIFNSVDFWNSMSLIVLDIELTDKNINQELGLCIDGSLQGFSFCQPKTCKPNKHTTWKTSHLHGNAWSSVKLDYDEFFAVFYDIKVMKAEVLAKGFEEWDCWPHLSDKM